jgi:putative endonuclease
MFTVYIHYSQNFDKYYIGYTSEEVKERIRKHNSNYKGGFTSKTNDWELKYQETYEMKTEAISREKEIKKKKSRKYIELLINLKG